MALTFSARSRTDLAEIGDYIAKDSSRHAELQIARLEQFCAGLTDNPLRFPVVRKLGASPLRRAVSGSYSVFYLVRADDVFIVRVLHSARDHEKLLSRDD